MAWRSSRGTARTRAAVVLPLLGWALAPCPATGQIEIRAAEREAELARIELEELPLRRHLLSHEELAVWLPEGWKGPRRTESGRTVFASAEGRRLLVLGRHPTPPGAGLLPILEELLRSLEGRELVAEVESVRRIRIAGRDAFEVAGTAARDGGEEAARFVVSMDPDHEHYRMFLLRGPDEPGEPVDVAFKRLIRDWSPLDGGVWTSSFELLRESLIEDQPSLAWAERNRLFDAMARPEAIGQPWFEERLRELARQDPRLLLDGVLHHHPRVRIGCIEALDPAGLEEPGRTDFYAAVMVDADPAVRFRVARRIVDDAGTAAAVLARLLEGDSEVSRAGAFQLLAAAPEERRAALVAGAFSDRKHYPEASQPFLAATLAEWGARDEAEALLRAAWKRTRVETLERATWLELLDLGDREALEAARRRLERPLQSSPLPLSAAAAAVAIHAEVGAVEPWRQLATSMEQESEGGLDGELDEELQAARGILEELISYLESLPETPSADDECQALDRLRGGRAWIASRRRDRACPAETATGLVRASVPRPGAYFFALLDLVGRLEMGSAVHNQAFHSLLDRLERLVDDWAGDPITAAATGVDLDAPWELQWWGTADRGGGTGGAPASGGAALRLSSSDPERVLDTVLRASSGRLDLEALSRGVLSTSALPLLPLGIAALWSEEQELVTGTDSSSSTPAPTETYLALGAAAPWGEHEHRPLYALEVDEEGSEWQLTHLLRRGAEVTLTDAAEPPPATGDARDPGPGEPPLWSRLEVDLDGLFGQYAPDEVRELSELSGGDLSFSAGTALEPDALATTFRLDGLSEDWLSLGRNVSPRDLRAPQKLLPESCLTWVGLSLNPPDLTERLRDGSLDPLADLHPRLKRRILELVEHLDGEAGVAVVGAPDPRSEDAAEEWKSRAVGYLSVEPAAADRFLRKVARRHESHAGRRFHRLGNLYLARVGRFLVAASNTEILSTLGRPPYLASSPMYRQVASRAPADAMLWAGWDTGRLADAVGESIGRRDGGEASTFPLEIFRSFGGIAGWLRRSDTALVGELATRPRLQSEATQARVRRLTGYGDLVRGSISARGLPRRAADEPPQALFEVTLRLPEELPDIELDWANERLDQELLGPGLYRFVSRAAAALPERSEVTLPITDPDLLPYTRNEHNLELHSEEIRELAETIRGDESDPARIVRAIVEWAHDRLDYTVVEEDVSTERILATRQADCTEFSQLTIALTRSLGIPARPVHGAYLGGDAAYFHRWAEVYLDRWYEVDSTWGVVQVPATNLRIPPDDGLFLASLPGVRFTVEAVAGADGGWARRLPAGQDLAPEGPADIAIDGDRILVALPAVAERSPAADRRVLYSGDGGRTFSELPAPDESGRPLRMLGGHRRLLWFHRAGDPAGGLAVHELDAARGWRRLRLPPALRESEDWTVGLYSGGYLALAGTSSRLLVLDRDLALEATVALPDDGAGEWVLAREQGLLARSIEGEGITLHQWNGDGWAAPEEIADSAELAVIDVHRSGDRVQVVSRHRPTGQILRLGVGGETPTRHSLSPVEARALAATTSAADAEWAVWVDGRDRVLTRRPLPSSNSKAPISQQGALDDWYTKRWAGVKIAAVDAPNGDIETLSSHEYPLVFEP